MRSLEFSRGRRTKGERELVELVFGIRTAGENEERILGGKSIFLGNVLPRSCVKRFHETFLF